MKLLELIILYILQINKCSKLSIKAIYSYVVYVKSNAKDMSLTFAIFTNFTVNFKHYFPVGRYDVADAKQV